MKLLRWIGKMCWLLGLLGALGISHSQGISTVQLDQLPTTVNSEGVPAPLRVALGLGADVKVQEVAQLPDARFEAFSPTRNYQFSYAQPIWLHLSVVSDAASDGFWQLEFPTVLIDHYEVFQHDASGAWRMQQAGDAVPHRDWALSSMRARFPIMLPSAGKQDVYVRVQFRLSANIQPVLVTREQGVQRDTTQLLWASAIAGLLLAIAFTCMHMSYAFRDTTYFWYAVYLLANLFVMLTYTGLAQRMLWPQSSSFANDAISVFVISVLISNAMFCRAMFGGLQGRRYHRSAALLVAVSGLYIALRILIDDYSRISLLYNGVVFAMFLFILYSAISAWRKGLDFAGYWLMVYVPYLMLCGLAIVKSIGLLTLVWLPNETPLVAMLAEAMAMLLCLNIYSRDKHAQQVKEQAAAKHDPLTGFLNATHFHRFAAQAWEKSRQAGRHTTVIYVSVDPKLPDELSTVAQEELMLKSVRMVRTAMREFDVVGRLGRQVIGICVTDRPSNEALAARLSRLIALGLMHEDPRQIVQFTLAVAEHTHFFDAYPMIEPSLLKLLAQPATAQRKPIRYYSAAQHALNSAQIPL